MKKLLTGLTIAAATAAAFMLLSPSPAEAAESKGSSQPSLYTFNDFMKVKWIKEPVLSPNGKKILFTMEKKNLEENKAMSSICAVSTETKEITSFTPENGRAYSAKWSPDGKKIAFIKSEDGDAQLWVMTSTGKNPVKITDMAFGASDPSWSPDSKRLIFSSSVYAGCATNAENKAKKEAKEKSKVQARIITELPYQVFDHWRDDLYSHLFIINADGTGLKDLTPGKYDTPPIDLGSSCDYSFSPDGKEVCYVTNKDKNLAWSTNNNLFTISLEDGKTKQITEGKGNDCGAVYSPDGRYIAYTSMSRAGFEADMRVLSVYDRKTGESKKISESLDRSIHDFQWMPDGESLIGNADNDGFCSVYRIWLNGKAQEITKNLTCDSPFPSKDGKTIYFRQHKTTQPPAIKGIPTEGGEISTVADINPQFANYIMNEPEHFHFKASDGVEVQGFIVKPANYVEGKKYGLVYLIHGGPQSSWTDDFHQRWNTQLFAAQGYAVATVNFRGSTGWGQDFTDAISKNWGGRPYDDLMEGLDYMLEKYSFIDKDRMAAVGASYGGFMVNWIMGHTDRFACAISHSGVFNTISEYGTTEELWFPEWEMGGTPYENRELYEKWNPVNYVNNFKTPCLVIHGDEDYRVPVSESKQLFTALKRKGVPAQFLNFPDECHFVRKPQNLQLWYKTMNSWIKRWLH